MADCINCTEITKELKNTRDELFVARLLVAKHEDTIAKLKMKYGGGDDIMTFSDQIITASFLDEQCEKHFNFGMMTSGGAKSYAGYIVDHIAEGRVKINKNKVKYRAQGGETIEESVFSFVKKVMSSTRLKANTLYRKNKDAFISELGSKAEYTASTGDLSKKFTNMAMIRSCNNEFCKEVSSFVMKNL